ncbi:hypothetical protein AMJ87_11355, partial [candidate division WOR_3 bacterium SM23_60]
KDKRQKAKGRRQKTKGKRQKTKGKRQKRLMNGQLLDRTMKRNPISYFCGRSFFISKDIVGVTSSVATAKSLLQRQESGDRE